MPPGRPRAAFRSTAHSPPRPARVTRSPHQGRVNRHSPRVGWRVRSYPASDRRAWEQHAPAGAPHGRKDADLLPGLRVYDAARMRVALFTTCLVDALFPDAGKATVALLERLGQPVEFPLEQTCCGQMHANSGYFEPKLVRRYVDVFDPYDAVVVPSGSCAGAIRHQHAMIA